MVYLEFHRQGTGEPFLIRLDEIKGVAINGIIIYNGEVIMTEETYEEMKNKLRKILGEGFYS